MGITKFLTKEQQKVIVDAIAAAEKNTSGEIRVHIETSCKMDVLDRATQVFKSLKMHKTELRNGVLIYVAVDNHKFAILGDVGINTKVRDGFWDCIKDHMVSKFSQNDYTSGLAEGIEMIGKQLQAFFPFQTNDTNELPNDISFGS